VQRRGKERKKNGTKEERRTRGNNKRGKEN